MSAASPLITNITFKYDGVMTLNGLTNNYQDPVTNGGSNPPACYNFITGNSVTPETVPGIKACGSNSNAQFGTVVSYNLPDGSMFTVTMSSEIEFFNDRVIKMSPTLSSGSMFAITSKSQSGSTLNVTIEALSS